MADPCMVISSICVEVQAPSLCILSYRITMLCNSYAYNQIVLDSGVSFMFSSSMHLSSFVSVDVSLPVVMCDTQCPPNYWVLNGILA